MISQARRGAGGSKVGQVQVDTMRGRLGTIRGSGPPSAHRPAARVEAMAQQPAKKRRMEAPPPPAHCSVLRLARHAVTLPNDALLSPGAAHSTRVAVAVSGGGGGRSSECPPARCKLPPRSPAPTSSHLPTPQALSSPDATEYQAFLASGRRVYSVAVPRSGAFVGERGKEGVFIAEQGEPATAAELPALQLRAEAQHLTLTEGGDGTAVLAAVDCYGRAVVAQARRGEGAAGFQVVAAHQLQPPDVLRCGGGCAEFAAWVQGCCTWLADRIHLHQKGLPRPQLLPASLPC